MADKSTYGHIDRLDAERWRQRQEEAQAARLVPVPIRQIAPCASGILVLGENGRLYFSAFSGNWVEIPGPTVEQPELACHETDRLSLTPPDPPDVRISSRLVPKLNQCRVVGQPESA